MDPIADNKGEVTVPGEAVARRLDDLAFVLYSIRLALSLRK